MSIHVLKSVLVNTGVAFLSLWGFFFQNIKYKLLDYESIIGNFQRKHLWAVVVSDNILIYYPIITWNIMAAEIGQYLHVAVGHILLYNIC